MDRAIHLSLLLLLFFGYVPASCSFAPVRYATRQSSIPFKMIVKNKDPHQLFDDLDSYTTTEAVVDVSRLVHEGPFLAPPVILDGGLLAAAAAATTTTTSSSTVTTTNTATTAAAIPGVDLGKEIFLSQIVENAILAASDFDIALVEELVVDDTPPVMDAVPIIEDTVTTIQESEVHPTVDNGDDVRSSSGNKSNDLVELDLDLDIDELIIEKTVNRQTQTQREVMEPLNSVSDVLVTSEQSILSAEAILAGEPVVDPEFMIRSTPDASTTITTTEVQEREAVAPSVSRIMKFAIPAIGVWLCSPLLSLIDTSAVGILSGTTQQAALNPAVAVTDYAALLIAFLYTGTTNMIAAAREKDIGVVGAPRTTHSFIGALQLSGFVGLGLGSVLFIFARPLLRAMIGNDGISPAVFSAAMKYVRIRALGMPAAAVIGTAQAASLGMQDTRSPLYVLAAAALVNFCGDMMFVGNTNPMIGGAAGAAWATIVSQYVALGLFLHWLTHARTPKYVDETKPKWYHAKSRWNRRGHLSDSVRALKSKVVAAKTTTTKKNIVSDHTDEFISVRGFLQNRFKPRDFLKKPSKQTLDEFSPYVLPVTSAQVGRVSGYVAMAHVVSSSLGTVSMAAQQVIVSLFYCLCPIADSLNLTAQTFVPGIAEKKRSKSRSEALRQTAKNLTKAGGIFGSIMVAAVCFIPYLSRYFTNDPAVCILVNSIVPYLIGFFAVHGMLCANEGVLLGQKDLNFLGKMYGLFFAVVPFFMMRVKRAALAGVPNINLGSIWTVFVMYQLSRFTTWLIRINILQRREDKALMTQSPQ